MTLLGTDSAGTIYFAVFGYKYPSETSHRLIVYDDIVTVSNYVAAKYNFSYIYFHSLISGMTKEPATTLRRVHAKLDA